MEGFFRTNEQKVGGHKDIHPSFSVWKKATEARLVRLWRNMTGIFLGKGCVRRGGSLEWGP